MFHILYKVQYLIHVIYVRKTVDYRFIVYFWPNLKFDNSFNAKITHIYTETQFRKHISVWTEFALGLLKYICLLKHTWAHPAAPWWPGPPGELPHPLEQQRWGALSCGPEPASWCCRASSVPELLQGSYCWIPVWSRSEFSLSDMNDWNRLSVSSWQRSAACSYPALVISFQSLLLSHSKSNAVLKPHRLLIWRLAQYLKSRTSQFTIDLKAPYHGKPTFL